MLHSHAYTFSTWNDPDVNLLCHIIQRDCSSSSIVQVQSCRPATALQQRQCTAQHKVIAQTLQPDQTCVMMTMMIVWLQPDVSHQALQPCLIGCDDHPHADDDDDGTVPAAPKTYSPLSCRVTSRKGSALLSRRKPSTRRGSSLGRAASTATLTMGAACNQLCSVSSAASAVQCQHCR